MPRYKATVTLVATSLLEFYLDANDKEKACEAADKMADKADSSEWNDHTDLYKVEVEEVDLDDII
jgi:hypothetical protein